MSAWRRIGTWIRGLVILLGLAGLFVVVAWLERASSVAFTGPFIVVDGDSLKTGNEKLRLIGIDAPELHQSCHRDGKPWPCGRDARRALADLIRTNGVECLSERLDVHERWLVRCRFGKTDINARMVEQGWAVEFGDYHREEQLARSARRKLWSGTFERPRIWRDARRSELSRTSAAGSGPDGKTATPSLADRFRHWLR